MKKLIFSTCCALSITASAQQLPNSGFDENWVTCIPWTSTNNNRSIGSTPNAIGSEGWHAANTIGANGTGSTAVVTNENGAACITNKASIGQNIPGYLTLGTPWSTAKVRTMTPSDKDGGTFGGYPFSFQPDAISFDYKSTKSSSSDIAASVIAYLWKGTYTQKDVPGNITYALIGNPSNPTVVDMQDRDRNILDTITAKGGVVSKTEDAARIAKIKHYIQESQQEFTNLTLDFTYETGMDDVTPEKINVIFAAGDYFSESPVANVSLTVDNVKLIYRSRLDEISFNEEAVENFDKTVYTYEVEGDYTENCLSYTVDGRTATATQTYDEATRTATITVSNVDADEDGQKQHVYTVKFKRKLTISDETTYDGTAEGMFDAVVLDRDFVKGWNTVCLPFDVTASDLCTGATAQEFASYNAESGLNFTIVNGTMQAGKPYLVFFPQAVSSDLMFENKAVTTGQPTSVSHDGVTFTGNYTAEMPMTGLYGVVLCEDGRGRIMRGGSETTLRSTRAYFTLPADLQTASLNINLQQIGDGTTTGIGATQTAGGDEAAYDLTGRRVQKTTQGLYIVGGRKVIVK
ncbi:MAG: hypothetical protein J1F06_00035 [Prevotellaceae bacterium]|nr:hypothetical protein [Prevotellaceae bacterium]